MKQKILHIRTVLLQVDKLLKEYTYLLCKKVNFSIIGAILHNLCLRKISIKNKLLIILFLILMRERESSSSSSVFFLELSLFWRTCMSQVLMNDVRFLRISKPFKLVIIFRIARQIFR